MLFVTGSPRSLFDQLSDGLAFGLLYPRCRKGEMHMSQSSNVIDLRDWFEGSRPSANQLGSFSNSRECIELLQAFTRIAHPAFRFAIIRAAREAATKTASELPKGSE